MVYIRSCDLRCYHMIQSHNAYKYFYASRHWSDKKIFWSFAIRCVHGFVLNYKNVIPQFRQ